MLNPHLNNIHILSARNKERSFYKKANSRAEYFRLIALNIYKTQMELIEDTRARAFRNSRNAAQGVKEFKEFIIALKVFVVLKIIISSRNHVTTK